MPIDKAKNMAMIAVRRKSYWGTPGNRSVEKQLSALPVCDADPEPLHCEYVLRRLMVVLLKERSTSALKTEIEPANHRLATAPAFTPPRSEPKAVHSGEEGV
jgi:hypothetical protein